MTSPSLKGHPVSVGMQLSLQTNHIQKVFMLRDICLSQQAQQTYEQLQQQKPMLELQKSYRLDHDNSLGNIK